MKEQIKTTIGGQALIEGILMRGPRKTAIVVRKPDGELVTKTEKNGTNTHASFWKLPFLRGMVGFWDAMKYGVSAINYSGSFMEDEPESENAGKFERWLNQKLSSKKAEKIMMGVAVALGIAMPVLLFFLLPTLITGFFGEGLPSIARNLIEGLVRIVIFLCFIILTSRLKDIRRTYMYHGAEHKSIACYESGQEMTVENVRTHSRLHPRCGTSFLFTVMIVSILVLSVFTWSSPLTRMAIRLAMLPVIVGISYEINRYVGRHDNALTRAIRAPGLALQRFTTYEPDDSMIEVAIEALNCVIPETQGEDRW